jgi:hypothetical protein
MRLGQGNAVFVDRGKRIPGLSLGELELSAGAALAVFFALFQSAVAG